MAASAIVTDFAFPVSAAPAMDLNIRAVLRATGIVRTQVLEVLCLAFAIDGNCRQHFTRRPISNGTNLPDRPLSLSAKKETGRFSPQRPAGRLNEDRHNLDATLSPKQAGGSG
jgi:hypothetical protein